MSFRNPDWFHRSKNSRWGNDMTTVAAEILHQTMRDIRSIRTECTWPVFRAADRGAGKWPCVIRVVCGRRTMSSGGGDVLRAGKLKAIPIWALHNLDDDAIPPDGDKATVAAIDAADGNAVLTFRCRRLQARSWSVPFRSTTSWHGCWHSGAADSAGCRRVAASGSGEPCLQCPLHFWRSLG